MLDLKLFHEVKVERDHGNLLSKVRPRRQEVTEEGGLGVESVAVPSNLRTQTLRYVQYCVRPSPSLEIIMALFLLGIILEIYFFSFSFHLLVQTRKKFGRT